MLEREWGFVTTTDSQIITEEKPCSIKSKVKLMGLTLCWQFSAEECHAGFWLACRLVYEVSRERRNKVVRQETHFIVRWCESSCRHFPCKALIKVFSAGWTGSLLYAHSNVVFRHKGVRRTFIRPQEGFTLQLPFRSQWMQMSPLPPNLSIKGIFTFAGSWFLKEWPHLRLAITNLADSSF